MYFPLWVWGLAGVLRYWIDDDKVSFRCID
jgi:hypothetical protein